MTATGSVAGIARVHRPRGGQRGPGGPDLGRLEPGRAAVRLRRGPPAVRPGHRDRDPDLGGQGPGAAASAFGRLGAVVSGLLVKTPTLRMRIDRALTIMRGIADDPSGTHLAVVARIPRDDAPPGRRPAGRPWVPCPANSARPGLRPPNPQRSAERSGLVDRTPRRALRTVDPRAITGYPRRARPTDPADPPGLPSGRGPAGRSAPAAYPPSPQQPSTPRLPGPAVIAASAAGRRSDPRRIRQAARSRWLVSAPGSAVPARTSRRRPGRRRSPRRWRHCRRSPRIGRIGRGWRLPCWWR